MSKLAAGVRVQVTDTTDPDGPETFQGILEEPMIHDDWHVRTDEGALTGPWDESELVPVSDLDTESSASRQHYIDTGGYLPKGEADES